MESKYTLRILFFVVVASLMAAAFGGCSAVPDPVLARADALMEEHPDSALTLLERVDTTRLRRASDRALYALLLTQAHHKTNTISESDTLINYAVKYYQAENDVSSKCKALFYRGIVSAFSNRFIHAMQDAIDSYDDAVKWNNAYWIAKTAELIADLSDNARVYSNVEKFRKIAIDNYEIAGRNDNCRYATADLAIYFYNRRNYNHSIHLADSIRRIAKQNRDTMLDIYCGRVLLSAMTDIGDYDNAKKLIAELYGYPQYIPYSNEYANTGLVLLYSGNTQDPSKWFTSADSSATTIAEEITATKAWLDYYNFRNDEEKFIYYTNKLLNLQCDTASYELPQNIVKIQLTHLDGEIVKQRLASTNYQLIMLMGIIIFGITIAFITYYIVKKRRRNKQVIRIKDKELEKVSKEMAKVRDETNRTVSGLRSELNKNIENLTKAQSELDIMKNSINELNERLVEMYKNSWSTLRIVSTEYYNRIPNKKGDQIILSKLEEEINNWKKSERLKEIEDMMDNICDGIVTRFKSQCTFLTENQIKISIMVMANLPSYLIALSTGKSMENFYSIKSRIIKKIKESDVKDREIFISLMSNMR